MSNPSQVQNVYFLFVGVLQLITAVSATNGTPDMVRDLCAVCVLLSAACCLLPAVCCLRSVVCCLSTAAWFFLPAACCLLCARY
jgi:hypothetical protein